MLKSYTLQGSKLLEAPVEESQVLIYISPTECEIKSLVTNYLLDEHTLASAIDPDEISRLEFEPEHAAIILKRPKNYSSFDELLFKISTLGIFLFKERIVIVMPEDVNILEPDRKHGFAIHGLKEVFFKVLSGTIHHFLSHLKVINQLSDAIEQKINASMENRYLLNMFSLQKSLVYYFNGISYNATLFEKLKLNAAKLGFTHEELEILDDIIIENNQCLKEAEVYTSILSSLMDARASIVNNNLSILIKRLTIINIVFLPITFIASVGGMSEYTALTEGLPMGLSYLIFILAMGLVAWVTYIIVKRLGFEEKRKKGLGQIFKIKRQTKKD